MKLFDKLIPLLKESVSRKGSVILVGEHRIPLRTDAFSPIVPSSSDSTVVFIDAGNAEFLRGANISVQFARLCVLHYKNNVRVKRVIKEFVIVVTAVQKMLDLAYEARLFDRDGNELIRPVVVDDHDDPVSVANHVRKMVELTVAKDVVAELSPGDVVVRDGDLVTLGLDKLVHEIHLLANANDVTVVGLSKTTQLCTDWQQKQDHHDHLQQQDG